MVIDYKSYTRLRKTSYNLNTLRYNIIEAYRNQIKNIELKGLSFYCEVMILKPHFNSITSSQIILKLYLRNDNSC